MPDIVVSVVPPIEQFALVDQGSFTMALADRGPQDETSLHEPLGAAPN